MRAWVTASIAVTLLVAAAPANARAACSAPAERGWHSCLSAAHRAIKDTDDVRFTRATPVLVVRYEACPAKLPRRKVAIRDTRGDRLAVERRIAGRCKRGVARWKATTLRPNLDVRAGTLVRSYWSRLADEDSAPGVRLGERR